MRAPTVYAVGATLATIHVAPVVYGKTYAKGTYISTGTNSAAVQNLDDPILTVRDGGIEA